MLFRSLREIANNQSAQLREYSRQLKLIHHAFYLVDRFRDILYEQDCPGLEHVERSSYQSVENGYQKNRIAVECNGEILPKVEYEQKILQDGDVLEIVSFVGGG